ncbi:hypothetical protein BDM02DRAFT_3130830 [Thelephora ganbajun]|uniref:Uncharacterized protein n=1 Tax=Thelephora ganbajun TaxID=370292 RepID=A0ACB6Z8C6_THEGA|nr:hypothetical protein BDM02DRAFT_3130830 [Thelephora ganbajun]
MSGASRKSSGSPILLLLCKTLGLGRKMYQTTRTPEEVTPRTTDATVVSICHRYWERVHQSNSSATYGIDGNDFMTWEETKVARRSGDGRRKFDHSYEEERSQGDKAKEMSEQDADIEEAGDDGSPTPAIAENTPEDGPQESIRIEVEELVLAIHKVDSSFEKAPYFSAISCTSLFACTFPSQDDTSSPAIRTFNFCKLVIGFYVHDSLFWVSVDEEWGEESVKSSEIQPPWYLNPVWRK